jgi:membrane associated rhomboid family serine protease
VLFLIQIVEVALNVSFGRFGITPRTEWGLIGIVCSPLLHANLSHLLANAAPLFVLLVLLLSYPQYRPWRTLAIIWGFSGFGTWLIGRGGSVHLGASSVIFGLAAFLIAAGFQLRNWRGIVVGLLVFLFYGGIFQGVIPCNGPISWEGHLCGAIAGIWAAHCLKA